MTRDKYIKMQEQLGRDINEGELPPDFDDLPDVAQYAINTFNMMGDRAYPDIGYMGKDYTNLKIYLELYEIEDKEFFMELLAWLDSRAIKKSSDMLKREHEKLKRKSRG